MVKPRTRAGTFNTFVKRYAPTEIKPDGLQRQAKDPAILAADERLDWTLIDCDGKLYIMPGFVTVNFMARILCERPWDDAEMVSPGYLY